MDEARQVRDFWFGKLPMTARTLDQRLRALVPRRRGAGRTAKP